MVDVLTPEGRKLLVELLDASQQLSNTAGQNSLIIEIGHNPNEFHLGEATAHDFANILVFRFEQAGDTDALLKIVDVISPRLGGVWQNKVVQLRTMLGESKTSKPPNAFALLVEMMRIPEVRDATVKFEEVFEAACTQIDRMGDYKDLHDQLHELQYCYNVIEKFGRKRFSDDEEGQDFLRLQCSNFGSIISRLRDVATRSSVISDETSWIQQLEQAQQDLQGAIENTDEEQFGKVIDRIRRVLTLHPTLINARLNEASRALRLPDLVNAMKSLRDRLQLMNLDPEKLRQFQAGTNDLAILDHALTTLINEHDRWQVVDAVLRRIEDNIYELDEWTWQDLKAKTAPLYRDSTEGWVKHFKMACEKVERKVATKESASMRSAFLEYRRQADLRFFTVNRKLKEKCDEVRKVGEPLNMVLRLMK